MRWWLNHGEFYYSPPILFCQRDLRFGLNIRYYWISILCGDLAIKLIEEPFVTQAEEQREWAI